MQERVLVGDGGLVRLVFFFFRDRGQLAGKGGGGKALRKGGENTSEAPPARKRSIAASVSSEYGSGDALVRRRQQTSTAKRRERLFFGTRARYMVGVLGIDDWWLELISEGDVAPLLFFAKKRDGKDRVFSRGYR